ncbi:hypothetical protein IA57_11555 [Mangrovimonas yunxiaonensis]|uniref:Cobalt transporter n=1 Tax=Mangrovimonas yunxiaonensis TaxID=1197477 RepID=A0A084THY2_9FLAO|nr:hypothetical protein [Mangrovimonas yunxiaonensis]KFB00318.1 hypothetical protein IA57_11555 [Mangrovimonas yunxiaonensis]MBR9757659.1 hypothetical protein [Algicola sp.]GGH41684.1 hypothetical protein GCM10011364_12650 [Mangrovimonas yunxiaonensis]
MHCIKKNTGFKLTTLLLVVTLLLPTAHKLAHAFSGHKHEVCTSQGEDHIHSHEVECEFYKFKINTDFTAITHTYTLIKSNADFTPIISQYAFISDYQKLPFSLRGPPYND